MHRGGHLEAVMLAYETWGELTEKRDNAILIFSGLSPSAHAASSEGDPSAGWWEDMIGPGLPLDTDRFFIIAVTLWAVVLARPVPPPSILKRARSTGWIFRS